MLGKQFLHGGDYNPEQWDETIWIEDMRLAKLANVNTMTIGIFSWSMLELTEGEYNWGWMDRIFELLNENGMNAILATPSAAQPRWMSEKYPEVLRVEHNRVRQEHKVRVNYCLSSPIYRQKCREMSRLLAERYGKNPALVLWHVSNEYHEDCHCDLCQQAFREWVQERYKTLDNLNERWGTAFWSHRYSDWSEIRSPQPWPAGEWSMMSLGVAWKRFNSELTVDFFNNEAKVLREVTPNIPLTSNIHTWDVNWRVLTDAVDIVSYDSYPRFQVDDGDYERSLHASFKYDYMRALKRQPFILMENNPSSPPGTKLRRPGYHITKTMQAVSAGSDSVLYFQWRNGKTSNEMFHGAVVNHDGRGDTRAFKEVAKVGSMLQDLESICGTNIDPDVAVIYDEENHWGIEFSTMARWDGRSYMNQVHSHYRAFWNRGIAVDVIPSVKDFSHYKVLVAPVLYMFLPGVAERIEEFVKNGGTFVTTFWSGYVDEDNHAISGGAPGYMSKVLGIRSEELDACANEIDFKGHTWKTEHFADVIHAEGAEVISTFKKEYYKGSPAITCNSFGDGKAYYMSSSHCEEFMNVFYGDIIKEAGVDTLYSEPLPKGVTCRERGGKLFVMNFAPEERIVKLPNGETTTIDAGQTLIL